MVTENRILKAQLKGRLKLSDAERATLGEIAGLLTGGTPNDPVSAPRARDSPTRPAS
jgi:hypothetical protein